MPALVSDLNTLNRFHLPQQTQDVRPARLDQNRRTLGRQVEMREALMGGEAMGGDHEHEGQHR
ncbi:hypothetical protein ABGB08_37320 [Acrocarpospora sp. B8E8]